MSNITDSEDMFLFYFGKAEKPYYAVDRFIEDSDVPLLKENFFCLATHYKPIGKLPDCSWKTVHNLFGNSYET